MLFLFLGQTNSIMVDLLALDLTGECYEKEKPSYQKTRE